MLATSSIDVAGSKSEVWSLITTDGGGGGARAFLRRGVAFAMLGVLDNNELYTFKLSTKQNSRKSNLKVVE